MLMTTELRDNKPDGYVRINRAVTQPLEENAPIESAVEFPRVFLLVFSGLLQCLVARPTSSRVSANTSALIARKLAPFVLEFDRETNYFARSGRLSIDSARLVR